MREYRIRVYDDHYLLTDEAVGVGTKVVEMGGLEEALKANGADPKPIKRKGRPRGTRKALGKGIEAPAGVPET